MKRTASFAAALTALLLNSCALERPPEKRDVNHFLADARDLASVRRVMVLPKDCTKRSNSLKSSHGWSG